MNMPSIKHAQFPTYMKIIRACYTVGITQLSFYHCDCYIMPSKQSLVQTAQYDWLCTEMTQIRSRQL